MLMTPFVAADDAPDDKVKITVGAFAPPGTPWDADWQTFKKNAEARSKGDVAVKLLIRAETGGEPITMSAIRRNRVQFGGFTIAGASAIVPELSMLLSPFFFDNTEELDYVMDEDMLQAFRPLFAEKNLYLVRWVDVGWLSMYGKDPIQVPKDAAGLSLRSQASEASQIFMTSMGGDMLQMSFQDLIPALQTGLVEGGETGVLIYGVTGLGKEAPHLTLTHHAYDTGVVVANYSWFMSLPKEQQALIEGAFPSSVAARAGVRGMIGAIQKQVMGNPATTVHVPSEDEMALWRDVTKDNYKKIIDELGGKSAEIYQAMEVGRAAYRAEPQRENKGGGQ